MKATKGSFWTALALAAALFGCQSEGVAPGGGNGKSVAGAMGDVHPMMDSTCQWSDTIYFQGIDGSLTVNKCGWEDELAAPIACTTPQEKWGYMRISNGYAFETTGNTEWVSIDFALPYGWYCSTNAWKFAVAGGMGVDANTGKPTSGNNDWSVVTYSPLRGEWKVALPLAQLPSQTSFDMACKLGITPIDVNGVPMTAYQTDLWAYKTPAVAGASPFVLNYTPVHCMATTSGGGGGNCGTPAATSSVCETVYKGVTCTGGAALGTTELVPEATGAGTAPVYNWSTGEHTSSLTVSPTTTTTYTCTVTNGTCAIRIVTFNVNVIDVACNIGGSNGGNGNSGNGGSGSGNGGSGSGNGGSGSGNGGSGSGNGNSTCGDVNQVVSGTGCSNNNNILGPVNNSGVLFANTGNKVTIKLDHTLPAGTQYKISWKRSGSGTASMKVSESASNSTYTQSGSTFTTSSASYVTKTLTTTASTRYLKLESTSSVDFYIDAVTYCFTPVVVTTPGVKVCHVPPGNPGGATTVCVSYAQLGSHLSGVCSASNGGGNGGNGGSGSGSGSNSGSGSGSGHGGNANCGPNHHNGNHSGCSHNSTHPANCGNGHSSGNHGGCSHQGGGRSGSGGSSSHSGGHQGCGNGAGAGHAEDYIGPCNANPCQ